MYKGETCGIGKTDTIETTITNKTKFLEYERIPIYGEINRDQLVELHRTKLYNVDKSTGDLVHKESSIGLHYDVYQTSKEDINIIMFELLILGSLNDYHCNVIFIPENTKFYIEIS